VPPLRASARFSPAGFHAGFPAVPGRDALLWRTTNWADWELRDVARVGEGFVELVDTNPPPGAAFYRMEQVYP
jgi:hypothetical protein